MNDLVYWVSLLGMIGGIGSMVLLAWKIEWLPRKVFWRALIALVLAELVLLSMIAHTCAVHGYGAEFIQSLLK